MMLCESKAEALAWRADLGAGETYLVQEFHDAPAVAVAGVAADGHALQAMAYRIRTNPRRPFGFGYGITVVEEPAAMDVAGQVLQLLGVRGPFALDLVPDAAGRWQVVDLNLRIWGSWTACQAAGMDVIGSYLAALGLGPQPKPTTARAGAQVPLLRTPPLDVSTPAQRMRWLRRDLRLIKQWSAWEGSDWAGLARRRAVGWAVRALPYRADRRGCGAFARRTRTARRANCQQSPPRAKVGPSTLRRSVNLAGNLVATVATHPSRVAIRLDDHAITYEGLDEASARVAGWLGELGIGPGDRVGLMLPNLPQFPVIYYGILRAGAVVVPMNPLFKSREVEYYLADSEASALFAWEGVATEAAAGAAAAGTRSSKCRPPTSPAS